MALVRTLLSDGYDVVVYNARGLGKTEYTSIQFANLTDTEEFERTFQFMKDYAGKDAEIVGIGLSMGANTLLKIAGQQKKDFPLKAIVSVNNPFDVQCAINLMRGNIYEQHLCRDLVKKLVIRDQQTTSDQEWKIY